MRWLLFLSRLAFISGVCILLWILLDVLIKNNEDPFSGTIFFIGCMMGIATIPGANISYIVVKIMKKKIGEVVPKWLQIANIFFFFLLIFYFFYLSDPYYHQK